MKIESFLNKSIIQLSFSTALKLNLVLSKHLNLLKLNYNEAVVLIAVYSERPVLVGPSQLSKSTGHSRARVSQLLSSLQEKGLLTRNFAENDSRRYKIKISPKGEKSAYKLIQIFSKIDQDLEIYLSETQYELFVKLQRKLLAKLT